MLFVFYWLFVLFFIIFMNISQICLYLSTALNLLEQNKTGGKWHEGFSNHNTGVGVIRPALHIHGVCPFTRSPRVKSRSRQGELACSAP